MCEFAEAGHAHDDDDGDDGGKNCVSRYFSISVQRVKIRHEIKGPEKLLLY